MLYITHDLATARHFSDEILVMYQGRVVERGPADEVILDPQHPYTKLLAAASPDPRRPLPPPDPDLEAAVADRAATTYDHYTARWEEHG